MLALRQRIVLFVVTLILIVGLTGCGDVTSPSRRLTPEFAIPTPSHLQITVRPTPKLRPIKQHDGKVAFLTFDDGPSHNTKRILGILRSYRVPATFFVVGSTSNEGIALYKQIAAEGHALGNHTFSHKYGKIYRSPAAFRKDVLKLNKLLEAAIGYHPDILRFPGGSNNRVSRKFGGKGIMRKIVKTVKEDGYSYFDWNVSSTDAAAPVQDKRTIINSVLGASRDKRKIIVLMHDVDGKNTTVQALPAIITGLKAAGFRFEKLNKSSYTYHFIRE